MISENIAEVISGTNDIHSSLYIEAVKDYDEGNKKSINSIKKLITSIEDKAIKEKSISSSSGDITKFSGYKNILDAFNILSNSNNINDLKIIFKSIADYKSEYTTAYKNKCRLVVLEYEMSVYMLVTALTLRLGSYINKSNISNSMVDDLTGKLLKTLRNGQHRVYLNGLLTAKDNKPIKEDVEFTESVVSDTIELIKAGFGIVGSIYKFTSSTIAAIKTSLFGILPLIRSCMYFWYKKKANTILVLDEQVKFIQLNIEQLKNIKNMDPAKRASVIKRQEAVIKGMQKKIEKLRAELSETAREATEELRLDDSNISTQANTNSNDDDFILEGIDLNAYRQDENIDDK